MYCKCEDKKEITNEAAGETFVVCSKNKGGCGLEITETGKLITSDEDLEDIDELLSEFERAILNAI